MPKLARARLLKLEEWSAAPEPALVEIFTELGLDHSGAVPTAAAAAAAAAASVGVRHGTNDK